MTTNTNTSKDDTLLSTDIYEISDFIDNIRQNNITDVSDTASIVGMFGYMNEIFSQTLQNTLIVVSETSNETIPTRAKFSKNVIAHALNYGITKIMSQPAVMTLMIYMPISYIESNFTELNQTTGNAKFIFDKDVPIFVDKYEFHLDYDIIFTRVKNPNTDKYTYTAMYDLFENGTTIVKQKNPISDISNPYITTLVQQTIDGVDYLAFSARLHQVSTYTVEKEILTDNDIENKTITFTFEDQLCSFDVDVEENDTVTHLVPVYSGLIDYTVKDNGWFNYEYINENTIRIIFSRDSYVPGMNAKVTVNIKCSEGSHGNFIYNNNFRTSMRSDKYNDYNGMYILVYPLLNGTSAGGKDKKSIKELKKIIPREVSSRGAIINTTDLQNFFNSINDTSCKLYFDKKRDNPFERLYYAHMLMRKNNNVYPTNTINLRLKQSDFKGSEGNNNLSINPGTIFYYYDHKADPDNDYATLQPPEYLDSNPELPYHTTLNANGDEVRVFEYISPFLITIDDDLISSYLLTIMKDNKTFAFDSINTDSILQFVATNMDWSRKFIYKDDDDGENHTYDNKYTMEMSMAQNNNTDYKLVTYHLDDEGNKHFDDVRVKVYMVLYADETATNPYRYIEAELIDYDRSKFTYDFRFTLYTDDLMDLNNRINIKGIYNAKPEEFQKNTVIENNNGHGYLNNNTYAKIYILADFGVKAGDLINGKKATEDSTIIYPEIGPNGPGGRAEIESLIPMRSDIVKKFLKNEIYVEKENENLNLVTIIKSNPEYLKKVKDYNNDDQETEAAILRYIRNNENSDFVQNVLLKDESVNEVINSYHYENLSRYTLCNVMSVDGGIDFYYNYSNIMSSVVNVSQIQKTDDNGNLLYKAIPRTDSLGKTYFEYKPIFMVNKDGSYYYNYRINRIPVIKNSFLNTEEKMEDFLYDLEERRKYINVCLYILEDTFGIDLKFFNTYGPSKRFYYDIPDAKTYKARVVINKLNVYSNTADEDDKSNIVGTLDLGEEILIIKIKGQWGYIETPYAGWVKISNTSKVANYIDNVALNMKFAIETQSSADKYITTNIINDVKEYIEDINEVNELHIPNIITLITNNYREQLIYFEFLDVNGYGASCQHLYLDDTKDVDTCPEFLNIAISDDSKEEPQISITVH